MRKSDASTTCFFIMLIIFDSVHSMMMSSNISYVCISTTFNNYFHKVALLFVLALIIIDIWQLLDDPFIITQRKL